jgi:hypothetical protein
LVCFWLGALTCHATSDEGFCVIFHFGPPEDSFNGLFSSEETGVSGSRGVVKEGDHPPLKLVVFRDNELVVMVPMLAIVGEGVGGGNAEELGMGVILSFEDGGYGWVKGGFRDEH